MHCRQELFKGEATIFAHVAKLPNCPELAYGKPEKWGTFKNPMCFEGDMRCHLTLIFQRTPLLEPPE